MTVSTAPTPTTTTKQRPSAQTRRLGYAVAVLVNGALLYLVNVAPGWEAVTFLTDDFTEVLGLLNLSLAAGMAVNLLWIAADPPWLRSLGQVVTSGIGLAFVVQMLDVFPVDFTGWSFDGTWLVRFVLIVAAVGTALGLLVQAAQLVRTVARPSRR